MVAVCYYVPTPKTGHVQYVLDSSTGIARPAPLYVAPAQTPAAPAAPRMLLSPQARYVVAPQRRVMAAPPPAVQSKVQFQGQLQGQLQGRHVVSPLRERDALSATARPAEKLHQVPALLPRQRRTSAPVLHATAEQSPRPRARGPCQLDETCPLPRSPVYNQLDISAPVLPQSAEKLRPSTKAGPLSRQRRATYGFVAGTENSPPALHHNQVQQQQQGQLVKDQQVKPLAESRIGRGVRRATVACAAELPQKAGQEQQSQQQARVRQPPRTPQHPVTRQSTPQPEPAGGRMGWIPAVWRARLDMCCDGQPFGGGAFAEVFCVRDCRTGLYRAMKVMNKPNFTLRGIERQLYAEIEAMERARAWQDDDDNNGSMDGHHIVRLLDYTEEHSHVFLLLELCQEGDMLRRLHAEPNLRFTEHQTAAWARQLFVGLRTIHALGYLHRDIKPDNLLLAHGSELKIGDFGWCCRAEERPTCLAGTFLYMAPEVLENKPQDIQVDVWSTGITLYQVLVGRPLLNADLTTGISNEDPHRATAVKQQWLLAEIHERCPPSMDSRPEDLSLTCWDFLRRTLVPDPRRRITVDQALEHPWLKAVFKL